MKCVYCGFISTSVTNSRKTKAGSQIWRRRRCGDCERIFSSYEKPDLSGLLIVSGSTTRPYQRFWLTKSLLDVFEPSSNTKIDIDGLVDTIELKLVRLSQASTPRDQLVYLTLETIKPVDMRAYMHYLANHTKIKPSQALPKLSGN